MVSSTYASTEDVLWCVRAGLSAGVSTLIRCCPVPVACRPERDLMADLGPRCGPWPSSDTFPLLFFSPPSRRDGLPVAAVPKRIQSISLNRDVIVRRCWVLIPGTPCHVDVNPIAEKIRPFTSRRRVSERLRTPTGRQRLGQWRTTRYYLRIKKTSLLFVKDAVI